MMVTLCVLLAAFAAPQDESKGRVEQPVKIDLPKAATEAVIRDAVLTRPAAARAEKYDLARTGIPWHRGIDAVLDRGRPILLFQLLGNLDDVFC